MGDLKKCITGATQKKSVSPKVKPLSECKIHGRWKKIGTICSARAGIIALFSFWRFQMLGTCSIGTEKGKDYQDQVLESKWY